MARAAKDWSTGIPTVRGQTPQEAAAARKTIWAGEQRSPTTRQQSWRYLNAKYPGTCPTCGNPINPLDPIVVATGHKARHRACHKQRTRTTRH